jgi:hypothetical protein
MLHDAQNGEHILIGPQTVVTAPHFPWTVTLNLFAQLTSLRGQYLPILQVRDLDDQVLWSLVLPAPVSVPDPLTVHTIACRGYPATVPRPGRYEVVLLLNDDVVARYPLTVRPWPPAGPGESA